MEKKVEQARGRKADALNRNIDQQARHAPSEVPGSDGPKRRTWEGYAEDYRVLSEELVEVSRRQQDALAQIQSLESQLVAKDADLKRVKNQRAKDLDRLAAVSRTRDLLEKRAAAQMAKVAAAQSRAAEAATASPVVNPTAHVAIEPAIAPMEPSISHMPVAVPVPAPVPVAASGISTRLEERSAQSLGWSDRRWWQRAVREGEKAHKERRLADAQLFFEVALLTNQTASLWQQLGHVLRESGQYREAEGAYRRALRSKPGDGELLFLSGYCLEMAGDPSGAVPLYEAAVAADAKLVNRYEHLRYFRERLGR